ncbi:ankyrin repeat-containing protein [Tanacetum coccineum]
MTKITDLEASFEQYKAEQAAIQADVNEHRSLLQETMDRNKGYPIPTGPTGFDSGPFSAGEYSNGQNHMASVSKVYQAERFFDIQGLFATGERLRAAMMCLEGLHEQFFSISQNRTARDYVTTFEKMAAQLPGLQEEVQEGIFIKGLKPDLRVAVRTQNPVGVRQGRGGRG